MLQLLLNPVCFTPRNVMLGHLFSSAFYKNFLSISRTSLHARMAVTKIHISELRKKYKESDMHLSEDRLESKNPISLFNVWYKIAVKANIKEPNAMTLATVNHHGRPTARMVILRSYDEDGFTFHTNYRSAKAKDLARKSHAALVLYWVDLCRSVRIEGPVEKLSQEESDKEFHNRPRSTKIISVASQYQSSPVKSYEELESMTKTVEQANEGKEIMRPDYWGGYKVKPERIEFWQGQSSRMSDRIVFTKETGDTWMEGEDGWMYQRLQP